MMSVMLVIAVTAFLSGAAVAVFVMLVIGIRKADQPRTLPRARASALDAVTRTTLSAGTWPNGPAYGDSENE